MEAEPTGFSGDSVHFRSFKKEAIVFAEYVGFGHVLKDTREIPIADSSISYAELWSLNITDSEIDTHRRAHQFLRSAITSEVDRGILHRAHFPTEAWITPNVNSASIQFKPALKPRVSRVS